MAVFGFHGKLSPLIGRGFEGMVHGSPLQYSVFYSNPEISNAMYGLTTKLEMAPGHTNVGFQYWLACGSTSRPIIRNTHACCSEDLLEKPGPSYPESFIELRSLLFRHVTRKTPLQIDQPILASSHPPPHFPPVTSQFPIKQIGL